MKLLTSKQAAESPADGRADGERAARLGCEQDDGPDFSWMLIEWSSQAPQHVLAHCAYPCTIFVPKCLGCDCMHKCIYLS